MVVEITSISERLQLYHVSRPKVKKRVLLQPGGLDCCVAHKKLKTSFHSNEFFREVVWLYGVASSMDSTTVSVPVHPSYDDD